LKQLSPAIDWLKRNKRAPFEFQIACWEAYINGESILLNAPTGSGKTYAVWLGILCNAIAQKQAAKGLRVLWITPLRALTKDIAQAMQLAATEMGTGWEVGMRTGDTDAKTRASIKRKPPQALVTTPESLHLLLASKNYGDFFENLEAVIVDEWHELLSSKRGVQIELALSRLRHLRPKLRVWGISATIGNLEQAKDILFGNQLNGRIIRSKEQKQIEISSVLPDEIERFPWAGHLGIHLLDKVLKIIENSVTTLLFTNTRSQAEIWYQQLLNAQPELAGYIAMHHGSIDFELRTWVENALHAGQLKVVVCTSSLDLGVDFRPVDTIIQIGSPKGVARFIQRAGRSGHGPGEVSKIWLVPTHSLELIEAAAMRQAIKEEFIEAREPVMGANDVLIQYLVTLAISDGFEPHQLYEEIKSVYSFSNLSKAEWNWILTFITSGGDALGAYPEFTKVLIEDGKYIIKDKRTALRHRLHIGTIVSDPMLTVKYMGGGRIGVVEEWFVTKLKPGDIFWFGGKVLELIQVRDMQVTVRRSNKKQGLVPQWMGGRMPLSSQLSEMIRLKLEDVADGNYESDIELKILTPLFELQKARSIVPNRHQLLIESFVSRDGYHAFFYPFEGRNVHEGFASLIGYRISKIASITFSYAMNDYGFELLSDQPIPLEEALEEDLFSLDNLLEDIAASINSAELARRKFREIASIAGLIFQGYPGKLAGMKHIQTSSRLLFDVFTQYDAGNLLLKQSYQEVYDTQLEEKRMRSALERINAQEIVLKVLDKPTPFSFPIMVDRLRGELTSETLEDRVRKMQASLL